MTILQYSGGDRGRGRRSGRGRGRRAATPFPPTSSGFPGAARTTNKWERTPTTTASSSATATTAAAWNKGNLSWKRASEKAALPTDTTVAKEATEGVVFVHETSSGQPDNNNAARNASETVAETKDKRGPILKGPSNYNRNQRKHALPQYKNQYSNNNKKKRPRPQPYHQPQPQSKTAKRIRLMPNSSNSNNDNCMENDSTDKKEESKTSTEGTTRSSTTSKSSGQQKQPQLLTDCAYRTTPTATGLVRVPPPPNARVCAKFARGLACTNPTCRERHDLPRPECALPYCYFFQHQGMCLRPDCPFRHIKVNPRATPCPSFVALGYCPDTECAMKHEATAAPKAKLHPKPPPPTQHSAFHMSRSNAINKKKTPNMSWRKMA